MTYVVGGDYPAALLTGANSGGKTTLLEHILSFCALDFIGLPLQKDCVVPKYSAIYYLAKNKGSANKGAFETTLMQLAGVQITARTLVLADELESVTEPGVAAKVMASTLSYFVSHSVHCVFATHLGGILQNYITTGMRIDGIHAKGLSASGKIEIDHNPRMNSLAASTPELIIQKLANTHDDPFFHSLVKALE